MTTPIQPQPPKQTNYLPWVLVGCAVALVLALIVIGVAGMILYVTTPAKRNGRGIGIGFSPRSEGVHTVDTRGRDRRQELEQLQRLRTRRLDHHRQ